MSTGNIPVTLEGRVGEVREDCLTWTLVGTKQTYRVLNWSTLETQRGQSWEPVSLDAWANTPNQLDSVAAMIRGEHHELPSFEAALRIQQLIERILR